MGYRVSLTVMSRRAAFDPAAFATPPRSVSARGVCYFPRKPRHAAFGAASRDPSRPRSRRSRWRRAKSPRGAMRALGVSRSPSRAVAPRSIRPRSPRRRDRSRLAGFVISRESLDTPRSARRREIRLDRDRDGHGVGARSPLAARCAHWGCRGPARRGVAATDAFQFRPRAVVHAFVRVTVVSSRLKTTPVWRFFFTRRSRVQKRPDGWSVTRGCHPPRWHLSLSSRWRASRPDTPPRAPREGGFRIRVRRRDVVLHLSRGACRRETRAMGDARGSGGRASASPVPLILDFGVCTICPPQTSSRPFILPYPTPCR